MGTPWRAQGVRIVHRYGTVKRSVELCRVLWCQNRVLMETHEPDMVQRDPTGPDRSIEKRTHVGP